MKRCLQLAENAKGQVSTNPMVGAVVVYEGKIIGEGYHREYGEAHAEVNAINSVKDKSLLPKSELYVSLEPCSHHGKTPPCSQLIINSKIPKVYIATLDPYSEVSGRGVKMLKDAGVEVEIGLLEKEAQELNKVFFIYNTKRRPYIYLKWAETKDGFIDKERSLDSEQCPTIISNDLTQLLVHKLRSRVASIMVGTNTAMNDNPSLTTRYWYGKHPIRIVLDRRLRLPLTNKLFDNTIETYVFTEADEKQTRENLKYATVKFDDNLLESILDYLFVNNINSVLVEGGAHLLNTFIEKNLWDESFIEISDKEFVNGVRSPLIKGKLIASKMLMGSTCIHFKNV